MFLFHSSARINDHSLNVTRKTIGSHRIRMRLEGKRDDVYRTFRVPTSKKGNLSYLSRVQYSRESSRVSICENCLKFRLLFVLFSFSMKVFPLLLLNSCEDYSSGSGTVTIGKGNVWWNCWESVMCIIIYTFNRYTVQANGSLPHIPVASGLST